MTDTPHGLFIPLRQQWFDRFARRETDEEWRPHGPRWNARTIRVGRLCTIGSGYSGPRLRGTIMAWRVVRAPEAPEAVREIYPNVREFAAIRIALDG